MAEPGAEFLYRRTERLLQSQRRRPCELPAWRVLDKGLVVLLSSRVPGKDPFRSIADSRGLAAACHSLPLQPCSSTGVARRLTASVSPLRRQSDHKNQQYCGRG